MAREEREGRKVPGPALQGDSRDVRVKVTKEPRPPRLCAWLLSPYLDLCPASHGPLHARRVEECWRAFADPGAPYFVAQRTMLPGFREELAAEAGDGLFVIEDPRQLPDEMRSDRWRLLCATLDRWSSLSGAQRCRLAALLHALCLYRCVSGLASPSQARSADPWDTELRFWQALARYLSDMPERFSQYQDADMSAFEEIALAGRRGSPARFNAAIRVFVHKAKLGDPNGELGSWRAHLERALVDAVHDSDPFTAGLLNSRFYRAVGFIPQLEGDRTETVSTMDRAEEHAYRIRPATSAEDVLYRENLHALMESRTKEALWLGDMDLALSRSLKVNEVDPYDAKAWAEVGEVRMKRGEWREAAEAYAVAAMLGPPAGALARHMAGICLRRSGQDMVAALLFKDSLEINPLGTSPREALDRIPNGALRDALAHWMSSTVQL